MERKDSVAVAGRPWELFALGALAPLGPYVQVHLAPKIPPGLLNTALMAYLSLEDDEYLLAVIDGYGGKLAGSIALDPQTLLGRGRRRRPPHAARQSVAGRSRAARRCVVMCSSIETCRRP